MADIFISYSKLDHEQVSKLASFLKAQGYSVWWLKPSDSEEDVKKEIQKQRESAKAVVVAWSVESIKSEYIKADIKESVDNKILFPAKSGKQTEDLKNVLEAVEKVVPKPTKTKFFWRKLRSQSLSLIGMLAAGVVLFVLASPLLELSDRTKEAAAYVSGSVSEVWSILPFGFPENFHDALVLTFLLLLLYNTLSTVRRIHPGTTGLRNLALYLVAIGLITATTIWSGKALTDQSRSDLQDVKVQIFPGLQNQSNCRVRIDRALDEFLDAARIAPEQGIDRVLSRMRQERGFESDIRECLRFLRISGDELADGVSELLLFDKKQISSNAFFLGEARIVANLSRSVGMDLSALHAIVGKSIQFLIVSYPVWPFLIVLPIAMLFSLPMEYRSLARRHWGILATFVAIWIFDDALKYFGPST